MNTSKKTWTICINCYNSAKTIKNTLDSIDYSIADDVDVFVINDGSKDNLKQVVEPFIKKYPHIIHYFEKENSNWGGCINFALKKVKSKYFSVLDSDDTYDTNGFKKVLTNLRKTNADLVMCNYKFRFIGGKKVKTWKVDVSTTLKQIKEIKFDRMPSFHQITIHSCIFNTNILKNIKPLATGVSYMDTFLIFQAILKAKKVAYINRYVYLYNYFININGDQSISVQNSIKKLWQHEVLIKYLLSIPYNPNWSRKRKYLFQKIIVNMYLWIIHILSRDNSRPLSERAFQYKSYLEHLEEYQNKYNCKKVFRNSLLKFSKASPKMFISLAKRFASAIPNAFLKATIYAAIAQKKQLKKAKKNQ